MEYSALSFPPPSRKVIEEIQSARKRVAFERARQSAFYRGRLDHVSVDRLDDPEEWCKIPVLDKEQLREIPAEDFHAKFAIAPDESAVEYWRSGGATGRPLFYPRSTADITVSLETWRRLWLAADCSSTDKAHISFPMGIHPVGQHYARSGEMLGIGTVWAGSGNNTPSELQIELIRTLKPTVWAGMASYGLQLASLVQRQGFNLADWSVRKILCAAEPLSAPKREKLQRLWGAEVYDQFGCTEGGAMGSESDRHDGLHLWTDLFYTEVIDEGSGFPVGEGQSGVLVMTPLYTNTVTPFLRWNMGDIGVMHQHGATTGPLSVFPVFRHAARTSGFFKVRGININHTDFEDFMHRNTQVVDFRLEVLDGETLDVLKLQVELIGGADAELEIDKLARSVRNTYEVTPSVELLKVGDLAQIFINDVKAKRFVDSRRR